MTMIKRVLLSAALVAACFCTVTKLWSNPSISTSHLRKQDSNLTTVISEPTIQRRLNIISDWAKDTWNDNFADERKTSWNNMTTFFRSIPSRVHALLDDLPAPVAMVSKFILLATVFFCLFGAIGAIGFFFYLCCADQFCPHRGRNKFDLLYHGYLAKQKWIHNLPDDDDDDNDDDDDDDDIELQRAGAQPEDYDT